MAEATFYRWLLWGWIGLAVATFASLFRVTAPYGRHAREGAGPRIGRTLGWVLMEAPSPLGLAVWYLVAPRSPSPAAWALFALWQAHYVNRAFVFPFRMRGGQPTMPLAIAGSAFLFNLVNSYLNGRWLSALGPRLAESWLRDPRFIVGAALFAAGWAINYHADAVLRGLRRAQDGYQIPRGGLYRFVSCPNYFGELVEWTGWALASWSLPGAAFALWTFANLVPRARAHHRWYREKFSDYPRERRAILPFVFCSNFLGAPPIHLA